MEQASQRSNQRNWPLSSVVRIARTDYAITLRDSSDLSALSKGVAKEVSLSRIGGTMSAAFAECRFLRRLCEWVEFSPKAMGPSDNR